MKYFFAFLISFIVFSCSTKDEKTNPLKQWIIDNQASIAFDIDTVISSYKLKNKLDSNWNSSSIATTIFSPNSLGKLAKIAGDTSECFVVVLTFYKNKYRKKEIMLLATQYNCLPAFNKIKLDTDSTNNFIFGKTYENY
jgi:hypothetical protein